MRDTVDNGTCTNGLASGVSAAGVAFSCGCDTTSTRAKLGAGCA
jgi:hypothetical protein